MLLSFFGIFLFFLTYMMPIFRLVYFDWIGVFILLLPWILDYWNMIREGTLAQTDTVGRWKTIIDHIDRNRDVHTIIADKPYHTQSFLECKGYGLIENKGKDSILKKGTKKYVLSLENCEHTPDPDNLLSSEILYELGIKDMYTLRKLLTGKYLDAGDYKIMGNCLIKMMTYHQRHGGMLLVDDWQNYEGKNIMFKPDESNGDIRCRAVKLLDMMKGGK
jgi:hypothetical protein